MQRIFILLSLSLILNSCNSKNTSLENEVKKNYMFFIDTTHSTACNVCLVEDLRSEAEKKMITRQAMGENHQKEGIVFDSLVSQKAKIIEVYKKELGADSIQFSLERYAIDECLKRYSIFSAKEDDKMLLLKFEAFHEGFQIPIPIDTIFNINDFEKGENGKYNYIIQGNKIQLTSTELEVQMNKSLDSYKNLKNYQNSMTDYYCNQYIGKAFSQMDKTEQLMFIVHVKRTLVGSNQYNTMKIMRKRQLS